MTGVFQNPRKAIPLLFFIFGLILVVLSTCKVPPGSEPPPGGIRFTTSGQPQSFFNGLTCRYAIYQSGGDPNNTAERIATGTFSLNSGSGVSDVVNLVAGQYDLYIVVDVDSDGYTFSGSYPLDGDLHEAETDVAVNDTVIDRNFTLETVAGEIFWSPTLSGDLFVDLCTNEGQDSFGVDYEIKYTGITNATSKGFAFDAKGLSGGPYYLLGVLAPPGGNLLNARCVGWYAGASAAEGTETRPVELDNLQNSYDFFLISVKVFNSTTTSP
jgi:hypothetical protein